nr:PREDICTED: EF-hand calcium-binding domain-containing protein 13 [Anolis carolinensis]|eukprot:XP_008111674.2 PREDICTED: EF-hand calcium-binding domain-containing protein 13 [Anolis carolinensis]
MGCTLCLVLHSALYLGFSGIMMTCLRGIASSEGIISQPPFSSHNSCSSALQNATKAVENIKTEKMTVKELEKTLQSMGVHLPNKVFNEAIKAAKTDVLQRGIKTIGATCDSQLHTDKLLTALDNLGIHLSDEEFQEVLNTIDVDDDGTINLKDFLMTLSKMPRFTDAVELHSNIHAFTKLKGEKVDVEELESMLHCLGIYLNTMEFQKALECTSIDENGKVTFKEFLVNVMDNERFSEFSGE